MRVHVYKYYSHRTLKKMYYTRLIVNMANRIHVGHIAAPDRIFPEGKRAIHIYIAAAAATAAAAAAQQQTVRV